MTATFCDPATDPATLTLSAHRQSRWTPGMPLTLSVPSAPAPAAPSVSSAPIKSYLVHFSWTLVEPADRPAKGCGIVCIDGCAGPNDVVCRMAARFPSKRVKITACRETAPPVPPTFQPRRAGSPARQPGAGFSPH